ncbi:unnamed protein product, partial [marine sediment metagenome]
MDDGMARGSTQEATYALAFETSSALGSVAVGRDGEVLGTRAFSGPRMHASDFFPTLDALCRAHSVQPGAVVRVYVSAGPGSFTGLRIGITAARIIALAGGVRVVAVPTLEVIAQNALDAAEPPEQVAVILDAKRGRVYAAAFAYGDEAFVPTCDPAEVEPGAFLAKQERACAILGEGVASHRDAVEATGLRVLAESLWPPRAETVYRLGLARALRGEFDDPRALIPIYLRPPE